MADPVLVAAIVSAQSGSLFFCLVAALSYLNKQWGRKMFSESVIDQAVIRVCDHRETLQIRYKYVREKSQELHYARNEFCTDCKKAIRDWFDNPSSSTYPLTLPALVGTEKRVKWAKSIRDKRFNHLLRVLQSAVEHEGKASLGVQRAILAFSMQTSALFWIDGRDLEFGSAYFMTEAAFFLRASTIGATFGVNSIYGQWKSRTPYLIEKVKACTPLAATARLETA